MSDWEFRQDRLSEDLMLYTGYWEQVDGGTEPDLRSREAQARDGRPGERVSNDGLDRIIQQGR